MLSLIGWGLWVLAFVVYEGFSLMRPNDQWQPATYYVRGAIGHAIIARVGVAGFLIWLFLHFFFGVT